ncbi:MULTISPECIES: hypothetical protein [Weissella]|uniref:Uncharacterized protein n=2 Tax=Weissella TaxID=46255 RepID=A0A482PZI5_WEICO|nr:MULTISPECIES: hypothetical protein [Weissella]MBJ7616631.1 hypothetical protein [Weissella confusa]MBJ7626706.1 hypothetical protein [Weissella confusa]MBJ7633003.1 hypothetical protein [Weissella confusa]MBJ7639387.1 hypothetical protein [Weissella confusa]MBJ7645788.1 hypothetical protein [Weissella confusa]
MKDILPGMTVHLTVGNYTDTTITVNGHKMTYTSIYEIGLGDTVCMFDADTENETVRLLKVPVHQY